MNRLLAVACGLLLAPAARAAVYVVDAQSPVASDANAATESAPLLTIQAGVDRAGPGDTVRVKPGVYQEQVVVRTGGLPGAPLQIAGDRGAILWGGDVPATATNTYGNAFSNIEPGWGGTYVADFVRISGFEIVNYWTGVRAEVAVFGEAANDFLGAEGWTVEDCVIHGGYEGISIWNGRTPERGSVVRGNLVYDQAWTDVHVHRFTTVERNVVLSHTSEENVRSCSAYELPGAIQRVVNNTVLNGPYGILVEYPGAILENNIVSSARAVATDWWSGGTYEYGGWAFRLRSWGNVDPETLTLSYNDLWANPAGLLGDDDGGTTVVIDAPLPSTSTGNVYADPLFVSGTRDATGDYHLTSGSPAVDAGDPATPVPPGGGLRVDIGAFELGADLPSLIALKHSLYDAGQIDSRGIVVALDAKLSAAKASLARGQLKTARNQVAAMINQTRAQAGKHLTTGAAEALLREALAVQRSLEARIAASPAR